MERRRCNGPITRQSVARAESKVIYNQRVVFLGGGLAARGIPPGVHSAPAGVTPMPSPSPLSFSPLHLLAVEKKARKKPANSVQVGACIASPLSTAQHLGPLRPFAPPEIKQFCIPSGATMGPDAIAKLALWPGLDCQRKHFIWPPKCSILLNVADIVFWFTTV